MLRGNTITVDQALQESEARYRQMFETRQAVKLIINPADGRIIEANPAAVRFYGYAYPTLTQMRLMDITTSTEADVRQEMSWALRRESHVANAQHRLASGEIREVEVFCGPVKAEQGDLLFALIHDVTERCRAEDARRTQSAALNATANGIVITDYNGRIQWVNPTFTTLTGYTPAEAIGKNPGELVKSGHHGWPFYQQMWETILAGQVWQGETINRRKDGHLYTEAQTITPVYDERGEITHFVSIKQDITGRKRLEEALQTSQQCLTETLAELHNTRQQLAQRERLAAVGQLAAGIAHDFNNILTGILGFAELLRLSPEIRQLLDFSRNASRQPRPIDLAPLSKEILKFLRRTLPENIQLRLDIQPPGEYMVDLDPAQVQQLLTNLMVNARDAMPGGGELQLRLGRVTVTDEARCALCHEPIAGEWVQIQLEDTGSGISPEALPHLFDPFYTTKEAGSGLGLSQVAGIVGQHGGHMRVESRVGQGSLFSIYLPPARQKKENGSTAAPPQLAYGRGESVLLVEDDPTVREVSRAMLESLNYQVLSASSGREALAIYAGHRQEIILVLSDMVMPDMDGVALFKALKGYTSTPKMVMMSGYPLGEQGARLLEQGIIAWVQKPISLPQLSQLISQAL